MPIPGPTYYYLRVAPLSPRHAVIQLMKQDAGEAALCVGWLPRMPLRAALKFARDSGFPFEAGSDSQTP